MTRSSDLGYRILAARSLRKQVRQLAQHLGGVRQGADIESIHRARVASRRLRAALEMFRACWKRKQVSRWTKQIRRLAQNLSEARDHDVQIDFLTSALAGVSDRLLVPGIAALLGHVERQRLWIQPRVLKAINRFEKSGMLKEMRTASRAILAEAPQVKFAAGAYALSHAGKSVRKALQRLFAEAPALADPEQHERHHAMRIAAKRLRYTLELARPVFAPDPADESAVSDLAAGDQAASRQVDSELVNTADAIKKLQTLLGEVHDCDVWAEDFEEFAHKVEGGIRLYFGGPQRFERLRPGLDFLRQDRKDRRSQVFGELAAFWQELKDQGLWDRLATILEWGGGAHSLVNGEVCESVPLQVQS